MKKYVFEKLIQTFMKQASACEKLTEFENMIQNPQEYGVTDEITKEMEHLIAKHDQLYADIANKLEEKLVDILTSGEDVQKEYLGFTANFEDDKDLARQYLDIIFKELCIFTGPSITSDDTNSVSIFLNTLEKDIESC